MRLIKLDSDSSSDVWERIGLEFELVSLRDGKRRQDYRNMVQGTSYPWPRRLKQREEELEKALKNY